MGSALLLLPLPDVDAIVAMEKLVQTGPYELPYTRNFVVCGQVFASLQYQKYSSSVRAAFYIILYSLGQKY